MNIFDIIILLFVAMFGVVGLKNGVIKEGVSFIGTIVIFLLSFILKGFIGNILCDLLPFFNFSGSMEGLTTINLLLYELIGFIIIFIILTAIFHIIVFASKILQTVLNLTIILILPSQIAGFLIGLIKGYLIVFATLLLVIIPFKDQEQIKTSKLIEPIVYKTPVLSNITRDINRTLKEIYTLVEDIEQNKITKEEANLQILDTALKYKITTKEKVEELINKNKLKISNASEILKKY